MVQLLNRPSSENQHCGAVPAVRRSSAFASTGCQWRQLLKDFPPYPTVQGYFYARSRGGIFASLNYTLVTVSREAAGVKYPLCPYALTKADTPACPRCGALAPEFALGCPAPAFEGEFSDVTRSYAGKRVVRRSSTDIEFTALRQRARSMNDCDCGIIVCCGGATPEDTHLASTIRAVDEAIINWLEKLERRKRLRVSRREQRWLRLHASRKDGGGLFHILGDCCHPKIAEVGSHWRERRRAARQNPVSRCVGASSVIGIIVYSLAASLHEETSRA
jgi:hypothetical protein